MINKKDKYKKVFFPRKIYILLLLVIFGCKPKGEDASSPGVGYQSKHGGMEKSYLLSENQSKFFKTVEKQTSWSTYKILNYYGIGYVTDKPSNRESFDAVMREGELIVEGNNSVHKKIKMLVESDHLLTLNYWEWLTSNDGTQTYEEWLAESEELGE